MVNLEEHVLHIKPRYYRWYVDPGEEWTETNTRYAELEWEIPLSQCAVVLVDVWNYHYLKDTMARSEKIIHERIVPLLRACRSAGLQLIHAPGPGVAERYPQWVGKQLLLERRRAGAADNDDWPPPEFRSRRGPYAVYARPVEPRQPELEALRKTRCIHQAVLPVNGDVVIADGEELHSYCRERGILFLFFLGFNTNACILLRDYGTIEMGKRGYAIILIRDCTTGMESFETQRGLMQTEGAVLFLEMFGHYSVTSEQLIQGLPLK